MRCHYSSVLKAAVFSGIVIAGLAFGGVKPATAFGIVYSARYYNPPSSHATSHYQIYRINPDGTHKMRLTHDNYEDYDPSWSPDGCWIAYLREWWNEDTSLGGSRLMIMHPDGTDNHQLINTNYPQFAWSKDSKSITAITATDQNDDSIYVKYSLDGTKLSSNKAPNIDPLYLPPLSPNGRYQFQYSEGNSSIVDSKTGEKVLKTADYTSICWNGNDQFLGMLSNNNDAHTPTSYELYRVSLDGTLKHLCHLSPTGEHDSSINTYFGADFCRIDPWPGRPGIYLGWENWHNSTVGTDFGLYLIDPKSSTLKFIAESSIAIWSPDKQSLCVSPGQDLSNYSRKKDGTYKQVFTAALQILDLESYKLHTLQGGLMLLENADWK